MPDNEEEGWWPQVVTQLRERPWVEYKRSEPWDRIKFALARAALGLVNLDGGGVIVVGVSESQPGRFHAEGMQPEHLATYVPDTVQEQLSRYGNPRITVAARQEDYQGRTYLVIQVRGFEKTPVVAARDTPPDTPQSIRCGILYVRPNTGRAETRPANAQDMADVISRAVGKGLRDFVRTAHEAGLRLVEATPSVGGPAPPDIDALYAQERGDL
jgi:predicted HTH transcriptional regulator